MKGPAFLLLLLLLLGGCTARPAFIPPPQRAFAGYQALLRPARELAVGALWIDGHGTYGPGAAPDNIETLPGIGAVVIDNDLGVSLSLGFLQYLDLDPTLQNKVAVRLNDVTLLRVKDMTRLQGPSEQPRVYEALRAGSATITTTKEVGLAIEARAIEQGLPVFGRGSSGRRSTFSIEAKDVYLAVRIATLRAVGSRPHRMVLGREPESVELHGLTVRVSSGRSDSCQKGEVSAFKGSGIVVPPMEFDPRTPVELKLAAPVGNRAALFDRLSIKPDVAPASPCAVSVALKGSELVSQKN